jgi:hypothetical protein
MMTTLVQMTCAVFAVEALEPVSALTSTPAMSGMHTAFHVHPTQQIPHFVQESMSTLSLQWVYAVSAEVVCMMKVASAQISTQPTFGILTLSHATATLILQLVVTQTTSTLS